MSEQHLQPPVDDSIKVPHLVFGLLFLGITGVWALVAADLVTAGGLTYLGPTVLIVAGLIGLAASLAGSRNRRPRHTTDPSEQDDHTEEIR